MPTRVQILDALAELISLHTSALSLAQRTYSLLAQCDDTSSPEAQTFALEAGVAHIRVDSAMCAIEWDGRRCVLGPSLQFRLLHRMAQHPGRYFKYDLLIREVWGRTCDDTTVRTAVARLRRMLRDAGMADLADAIRGRDHCYGLFLDAAASSNVTEMPHL